MTTDEKKIAEHSKCSSCGAEMLYSAEAGMLVCPYCGSNQKIATQDGSTVEEHDFSVSPTAEQNSENRTIMIHCSNCGAEITVDETTSAQICAFCGSPMLIKSENTQTIVPEGIIPFKITEKIAIDFFKRWIKSKFFSPRKLRDHSQVQKLKGVYVPHFTYDCDTNSDYTAQAGTYYYETEIGTVERDGQQVQEERQVRKTSWRTVRGTYSDRFDDVLVNASKNVDRKLISLEFDFSDLVPYKREYTIGYLAENNSISKEDCWHEAKNIIKDQLEGRVKSQINADEVKDFVFNTDYSDVKFKEILLPVWISVYTYKGKTYKFMINGQSGEVKGQAPHSALRIILSILLTLGATAGSWLINPVFGILVFIIAIIILSMLAYKKPK